MYKRMLAHALCRSMEVAIALAVVAAALNMHRVLPG